MLSESKWPVVREIALQNGASEAACRKWRTRGVPGKWQVLLVRQSDGLLSLDDFVEDEPDSGVRP